MKIQVRKGNCLEYRCEVILLFHFNDTRPLTGNPALLDWRCNASVSVLWKKKHDLFRFGQLTIIATQGKIPAETVILTGLGASDELDRDMGKEACRLALAAALKVGAKEIAVDGTCFVSDLEMITPDVIRSVLGEIDKEDALRIALFPGDSRQQSLTGRKAETADGAV